MRCPRFAGLTSRTLWLLAALVALAPPASAGQPGRGVVLDQTGLVLPGATVQLLRGPEVVTLVTTAGDGAFEIDPALPGDTLVASLDGFETSRVPRAEGARIVLSIAHATETTTVFAPVFMPASPSAAALGSNLTAATVARLPSSRMKARESLPLLPSVVRGPDGLMQLGGARAHEAPLLLDGFNVTDPATGNSSINLPFEAVRGVEALRDPMAVTYGTLLGGVVNLESRRGGDRFAVGVQGFVPRPRFSRPGFGRLEGIFPRVHASGAAAGGRVHYLTAAEYDFERIPVPQVTQGGGPDIVEKSAIVFGRVDVQVSARNELTIEGLVFPSSTDAQGLSPRREDEATSTLTAHDLFGGVTNRFIVDQATVFTVQAGVLSHDATLTPNGSGPSYLSPAGWRGNWFASLRRTASRVTASATWERTARIRSKTHELTVSGSVKSRRLHGSVTEGPVSIADGAGRTVRTVEFGPSSNIAAHDWPLALLARDVWHTSDRVQLELGTRLDHSGRHGQHGGASPSGRIGVRYAMDEAGLTVIKGGYGSFIGSLPLVVEAFGGYPVRADRRFNPETGATIDELILRPSLDRLRLPRAVTATIGIERQLLPGLDAQVSFTDRRSTRLATLLVPRVSGLLSVRSNGHARYRELQVSARRTWARDQQAFVSYVRSMSRGELNDFAALFQGFGVPLVQAGGMSRLAADAPNRMLAWGTFNLPRKVVVSPVLEWRTGFPYSAVTPAYLYVGTPNDRRYPHFMSTDLVVYKTVTVKKRTADVGIQLFNATNHHNPRDVYPVLGSRCGEFTNSVGPILRGYMLLKW